MNPVGSMGYRALAEFTEACEIGAELGTLIEDLCLQLAGGTITMSLA